MNNANGIDMQNNPTLTDIESSEQMGGVPIDFINSFGGYVGLSYFMNGVRDKNNVFTFEDIIISIKDLETVKSKYQSYKKSVIGKTSEIYEFYNEGFGYISLKYNSSMCNQLTIVSAIGYDGLRELIESLSTPIERIPSANWVQGIDKNGELIIKQFAMRNIHKYNPNFYPFMKGVELKDFVDNYNNSNESILFLIGPPGTSKTNFIRQIVDEAKESVLITYSDTLKEDDTLFGYFYDSPEKYLVIEDADTFLQKREDGNSNMKQLLNITDGLTANPEKKVIFSTNLSNLSKVDKALLRPGRCHKVLEFNPLKGDDLLKAAADVGILDKIDQTKSYTIAELFGVLNTENDIIERNNESSTAPKFGFGNR